MNSRSLVTLILLFYSYKANSQNRDFYIKDSLKITNCTKQTIDINSLRPVNNNSKSSLKFPFASIDFIDVRFDTSYFAVLNSSKINSNVNFKKVTFSHNTSASLKIFFNDTIKYSFTKPGDSILCFIKQLRVTQVDSLSDETNQRHLYNRLFIEIEAFLKIKNNFYPAFRIDTVVTAIHENNKNFNILQNVLERFGEKAAILNQTKILNRKNYSLEDLQNNYARRLNKPIIKDSFLVKGAYQTKEEFLNNSPTLKESRFRIDKETDIFYIKSDNNEWLPSRNAFGFCDGNIIWINRKGIFHPLVRQGNTFEFIADPNLGKVRNTKKTIYLPSTGMSGGLTAITLTSEAPYKYYIGKSAFQLNLDNGEFY